MARIESATTPDQLKRFNADLFEVNNKSVLSQLAQKMFSLQESMQVLSGQSVRTEPSYSIAWEERLQRAVYREEIDISSRQDALLDSVDASLLEREAQVENYSHQMWLQQDNGSQQQISDPSNILIQPRSKSVKLIYERYGPTPAEALCQISPLSPIRRLRFVWPPSSDSIRLGGVVTKGETRLPVWFNIVRSDSKSQTLRHIRLPQYSFFASAMNMEISRRDGNDDLLLVRPPFESLHTIGTIGLKCSMTKYRFARPSPRSTRTT